jgi:hypothetical protein
MDGCAQIEIPFESITQPFVFFKWLFAIVNVCDDYAEGGIGYMREVRTEKGKLVGKLDERTGKLHIKNGRKITVFDIPATGLRIYFSAGIGRFEEVFIPPAHSTIIL